MRSRVPDYSRFARRLDVDGVEEALGFEPIRREGDEDVGYCLFPERHAHGDTTGKFSINRSKKIYGCWTCGGGSLLSLVMELEDLDDEEATEWLYRFADGEEDDDGLANEIAEILGGREEPRPTLPYFNPRVLDGRLGNRDHPWLRQFDPVILDWFNVSYDPRARTRNPETGESYVGPGILFPHYHNGKLVGWQTRWVADEIPAWLRKRKYTNTIDFPRRFTLYGYDVVSSSLEGSQPVHVCESGSTTLYMWSRAYPTLGTFGGAVTPEQVKLLRRFQGGVILAPDNDDGSRWWLDGRRDRKGRKVKPSLVEQLEAYVPVTVVDPPEIAKGDLRDLGDDLDEHLASHTRDPNVFH